MENLRVEAASAASDARRAGEARPQLHHRRPRPGIRRLVADVALLRGSRPSQAPTRRRLAPLRRCSAGSARAHPQGQAARLHARRDSAPSGAPRARRRGAEAAAVAKADRRSARASRAAEGRDRGRDRRAPVPAPKSPFVLNSPSPDKNSGRPSSPAGRDSLHVNYLDGGSAACLSNARMSDCRREEAACRATRRRSKRRCSC